MKDTKILVVEDNQKLLYCINNYLKKLKIEILLATNGILALEIIKKYKPNIILLDLNIPKLNGIELLKELGTFNNSVASVIIISGEKSFINQIPLDSYNLIKGVLCKPVALQDIYNKIEYILIKQTSNEKYVEVKKILKEFEFNKCSKGYWFLLECLNEITSNPEGLKNIEKIVYKKVASKHKFDNINQIKWCISKTIKSMVRYTDNKTLNNYFGTNNNITPKYFIITMYNIINKENYNI